MLVAFTQEELALLHETLSYALKRTYSEPERVRIRDLQGRLEERLLSGDLPAGSPFPATEPEVDAFRNAADIYCDALERPLSAEVSQAKAARVRELVGRYRVEPGFLQRIRRFFGRSE
jgi:hypothetical protein